MTFVSSVMAVPFGRFSLLLAVVLLCSPLAQAQVVVGYFTDGNVSSTGPAAGITSNSYTAQRIADITTFDFSTIGVLVINESSNSGYSSDLAGKAGAISTFVQNGGILLFHDRYVSGASTPLPSTLLPGASGISFVRSEGRDINLGLSPSFLSNGTFGTLTDTTLDNGNQSTHGYITVSTLPTNSKVYLTFGSDSTKAVAFDYKFGSGTVYYSAIPLDFYLNGNTPAAFAEIYYPNLMSGINQLKAVPEPSIVGLLLAGLLGLGFVRKFLTRK